MEEKGDSASKDNGGGWNAEDEVDIDLDALDTQDL
jgi:hypothetical protein